MVRRCPYIGKAERHICRLAMSDQLNRNQTLIMIRRNHDVELTGVGAISQAIRRMRGVIRYTLCGALSDRECEHVDIFATEQAAVACVGVDRRYGQPLRLKLCVYEPNKPHVLVRLDLFERLMERKV